MRVPISAAVALACLLTIWLNAQDNYEIQVYGSETVPKGYTMVELHSNFTVNGSKKIENGVLPTNHAWHETLEITHGFNDWFEVGFYVFSSARNGNGWHWIGSHIRPRVRAPEKWHLPVGLSLSTEFGYQRKKWSEDTWSLELRPIVDKQIGKLYLSFNPTLERALRGPNTSRGFEFSPNVNIKYDVTKKIAAGIEYYGGIGPIYRFDPLKEQSHQFVPAIDLNVSPKWEFNFGVGVGVTHNTDHLIIKTIVGRRFNFKKKH
ncbi:MAG: hypothetical protein JO314_01200 [Acidobacteria bacterium]|nr:hypothetical protein [Acidobacteriota bacterium]